MWDGMYVSSVFFFSKKTMTVTHDFFHDLDCARTKILIKLNHAISWLLKIVVAREFECGRRSMFRTIVGALRHFFLYHSMAIQNSGRTLTPCVERKWNSKDFEPPARPCSCTRFCIGITLCYALAIEKVRTGKKSGQLVRYYFIYIVLWTGAPIFEKDI